MAGIPFNRAGGERYTATVNHIAGVMCNRAIDVAATVFFDLHQILSHSHHVRINLNGCNAVRHIARSARIHVHRNVQPIGPF